MVIDNKCASKEWITNNYNNITIAGIYTNNQLAKEEDISIDTGLDIIHEEYNTSHSAYSYTTIKSFTPSKPFSVEADIILNSYPSGSMSTPFIICYQPTGARINMLCLKVDDRGANSDLGRSSFWISADKLGVTWYSPISNGVNIKYTMRYSGSGTYTSDCNLYKEGFEESTLNPTTNSSTTLYYCLDPRGGWAGEGSSACNITINKLIIRQ